jgi:DNA-binding transcriptional LysR family regulator
LHNPAAMFDWDDLRPLLAVARHGSTLAAARALGVNQSTVQRRLSTLEERVGQPLVQRSPTGYRLTEFGTAWLRCAERVEQAVIEAEHFVETARRNLSGVVRVTCPEPLMVRLSRSPLLERFRARYPGVQVEFVMSDKYLDLARGDADIALRSGDTDAGELVGRKIGDSLWALYASRAYVERAGQDVSPDDFARHAWVGLDPTMAEHRAARWLGRNVPAARIVVRSSSVLGLVDAAKSGAGVAPLPIALGDAEDDLVRLTDPIGELTRLWRVLAMPEVRRIPRVAAFFDFLVEEVETLKPVLTG